MEIEKGHAVKGKTSLGIRPVQLSSQ